MRATMYRSQQLHFDCVVLLFCGILVITVGAKAPICCFPNQFESFMFAAANQKDGNLNMGGTYTPVEGTIRTAYDVTNKRTYVFASVIYDASDDPGNSYLNLSIVQDYKHKVSYTAFVGGKCFERPIYEDLFIECIPGDAKVVGSGLFGDRSTKVVSYGLNVTLQNTAYYLVVSVINTDESRGECLPVRISLTYNPLDDLGTILVTNVVDVTRGIKDPSVFKPPPNCISSSNDVPLSSILKTLM